MKIGSVVVEIFGEIGRFCRIVSQVHISHTSISGVTGLKFTIFVHNQGRSDGGYIGIYTHQNQSTLNFYVVTGCFFSLTQDKFDIVPVCALARVSFTYLHTIIIPPK